MVSLRAYENVEVQEAPSREPLTAGVYKMAVVKCELIVKNGEEFIEVTFEIVEGDRKGRRHWERFMQKCENEVRIQIAARNFVNMGRAVGVDNLTDTDQLLDKPMMVNLKGSGKTNNNGVEYLNACDFAPAIAAVPPTNVSDAIAKLEQPIEGLDDADPFDWTQQAG